MSQKRPVCKFEDCNKRAGYGYLNKKNIYCRTHKHPDMIDTCHKHCEYESCTKIPCMGFAEINKKVRCKKHALPGMINLISKLCECGKIATYGFFDRKPIKCKSHAESGMYDVVHKRCDYPKCNIQASFGYPGKKITRCKNHAESGMKSRNKRTCEIKGCNIHPSYGFVKHEPLRCRKHIEPGMKDVVSSLCKTDSCVKQASYGCNKKEYCAEHKTEEMKLIGHDKRKCDDCNKIACFGYEQKQALKCKDHKENDMKNVTKPMCDYDNCETQPSFGYRNEGNKVSRCYKHKLVDMINKHKKNCQSCDKSASFGYEEKKPLFCRDHKKNDMSDVVHKKCISCKLFIVTKGTKCQYCNPNARQKTKEKVIYDYLIENNIKFEYNKNIGIVYGSYRPDILIDCGTHFVVVECDEEQHKWYGNSCELVRMNNIYIANGLPTVFLRYNPDTYKRSGKAVRIYKKRRLANLLEQIEYHTQHIPSSPLSFVYLYYDCECEECDGIHDNTEDMIENFKDLILS
jgi:hypothetical protein